ncbi:MAG: hypothetical protein LBT59_22310, partial [Clostridiales bacterium]|nr:hypothetical protein [Clostridiales bacterium]
MLSVDLTQKPDLKQSLTLEQRQSLAVLLMGNQELEQHLKTQLLDNPFLEEAYPAGAIAEDVPEHEHELDSDIKDSLAPELDFLGHAAIEGCQAHLLTLADRLAAQLGEMAQNDRMKRAGLAIIGMLDDDGFFRCDADWLEEKLGWPKGLAERALALVQSLDPPGIAARDLEECLRLQLEKK